MMDNFYIKQWNENKDKLKTHFEELEETYISYEYIVEKLFELVITKFDNYYEIDVDNLVTIDHGDYQGTTLYIIPSQTYQPSVEDYIYTHNYYGSCSGCDTLLSIIDYSYDDDKFDEEQIKDLMTVALHLVQNIKKLTNNE